ncbi:baseplate wedge protein [Proteus phage 309]|uniref:Baseplate wedge protein n=1 Tax=Proteus phage 309 TaxID=2894355 RepID=A0AAE9C8F5_9CAUD|nr:baseplate wedge protein [Proteus phage 309]
MHVNLTYINGIACVEEALKVTCAGGIMCIHTVKGYEIKVNLAYVEMYKITLGG